MDRQQDCCHVYVLCCSQVVKGTKGWLGEQVCPVLFRLNALAAVLVAALVAALTESVCKALMQAQRTCLHWAVV